MNEIPLIREGLGMRWRWLTVVAGLLLTAMFFVPLTGSPVTMPKAVSRTAKTTTYTYDEQFLDTPRLYWVSFIERVRTTPLVFCLTDIMVTSVCLGLPYFWALCMALYSLFHILNRPGLRRTIRVLGVTVSFLVMFTVAAFLVMSFVAIVSMGSSGVMVGVIFGLITILLIGLAVYTILAIRRGSWGYLYHGYIAALVTVALYILFVWAERNARAFNGLTVSLVAAILMLLSRVGEARAISRTSWLKTFIGLLTFRLERVALQLGHCVGCGYNLTGNVSGVCPECGAQI